MLFSKYSDEKRDRFVICSQSTEPLTEYQFFNEEQIINTFNEHFLKNYLSLPPYNYVVWSDRVIKLKSCDLLHNTNTTLSPFNDDIKILLLNDGYLSNTSVINQLISIIGTLSKKYSLRISNNVHYLNNSGEAFDSVISDIERGAIIKRNSISGVNFMSKFEYINDSGSIVVNTDLVPINNSRSHKNLLSFAEKYSIPVSVLQRINAPYTSTSQLFINDTIFIPAKTSNGNVTACKALVDARKNRKDTEYTYLRMKSKVEEVIANEY